MGIDRGAAVLSVCFTQPNASTRKARKHVILVLMLLLCAVRLSLLLRFIGGVHVDVDVLRRFRWSLVLLVRGRCTSPSRWGCFA